MESNVTSNDLPRIEDLPQRTATQVKNKWADLVRAVRAVGGVAVTQHDRIEMVVMDATTYQKLATLAEDAKERRQAALAELSAEFDRRLAALKGAETRGRIETVMAARGRSKRRPKAGVSF
jgi:PHD/YefM family antitoxin component YafN of YafNO toxin-antitoxin module